MAAFFILLAALVGAVLVDAVLENSDTMSAVFFNRTFDQLSAGELLLVFAGLGFLLLLFLLLAGGASRTRRTRRRERRAARRDLEGQVAQLEGENAQLREELRRHERVSGLGTEPPPPRTDQPVPAGPRPVGAGQPPPGGPEPLRATRERLDDRAAPPLSARRQGPPRPGDQGRPLP
jgi:hypothetical protein